MMKGGEPHFSSLDSGFLPLSQPPSLPSAFQSIQASTQLLPTPPSAARRKWTRADAGKPRMPAKVTLWSAWQGTRPLTPRLLATSSLPARQSMPLDVRSTPAGRPLAPAPSSLSCSSRQSAAPLGQCSRRPCGPPAARPAPPLSPWHPRPLPRTPPSPPFPL